MLNLTKVIELTQEQKKIINEFGTLEAEHWKKKETKLRYPITEALKIQQKYYCVYCGRFIGNTHDVEHIAPKAQYPQFVFTPKNLAYACKTCNQSYKGQTDVVSSLDPDYEKCTFNMVHPYLDDVDHFFNTRKATIQIKQGLTPAERAKALRTVKLLHWDDSFLCAQRIIQAMADEKMRENGTSITEELIKGTLEFPPQCV